MAAHGCSWVRIFDGISDAFEANQIYNNWPLSLYPDPSSIVLPFIRLDSNPTTNAWVSVRGNIMVNNGLAPYGYADNTGGRLPGFLTYSTPFMDTTLNNLPVLDATNSVYPRLKGFFPTGLDPYTNIMVDVYQLDPEGWTNGLALGLLELTDYTTYTNGFPQGRKYLGSFPVANTGALRLQFRHLIWAPVW